jgi:hypothetical protein
MYDEKLRFEKYFLKTFQLHSISKGNEFMVYLNANNSKIFEQPRTKLRITVNTGLFGKSNKISKSLYEKDLSSGLNDYILKQFFTDPGVPLFLTLYIIIIKNSKNLKMQCLKGVYFAIREMLGKNIKILACKSVSFEYPSIYSSKIYFLKNKFLYYLRNLSVLMDIFNSELFSIVNEGLISYKFLILNIYYLGHSRWVVDLKKK